MMAIDKLLRWSWAGAAACLVVALAGAGLTVRVATAAPGPEPADTATGTPDAAAVAVAAADRGPAANDAKRGAGVLVAQNDGGPAVTDHDGVPGTWLDGPAGFAAGVKAHRQEDKPLLIYVYTDWCPYCAKFNRNVLPNQEVQACLNNFARVKLNPDRGQQDRQLARELRISGYPTLLVRHSDDIMLRPLNSQVSPAEFLQMCRREAKG